MNKTRIGLALAVSAAACLCFGAGLKASQKVIEVGAANVTKVYYLDLNSCSWWKDDPGVTKFHAWDETAKSAIDVVATAVDGRDDLFSASVTYDSAHTITGYNFQRFVNNAGAGESSWNEDLNKTVCRKTYEGTSSTYLTNPELTVSLVGNSTRSLTNWKINDGGNFEYYKTSVQIANNEVFHMQEGENSYCSFSAQTEINSYFSAVDTNDDETNDAIKCTRGGKYDFYYDSTYNSVWIQMDAVEEAISFAQAFLSATDTICAVGGDSANHLEALEGIWKTHSDAFGGLTNGAKSEFNTNADSDIVSARNRYKHIMARYASQSEKITNWTGGPSYGPNDSYMPIAKSEQGNAITPVVVGSFFVVAVVGLVSLITIRKREGR